MLIIKNISKTYTTKGGVTHRALENVSLSFEDKGLVFILGKSGSGKSTLLNIIAGIDVFDRGEITLGNRSFKEFKRRDFNNYRNTMIGFVFQEYHLIDAYKTYDNIRLALSLQSRKDDKAIKDSLVKYEIEELANRKTFELSGGQKQRIAIARALVKNPKIILADEPSGALDEATTVEIFNILKDLSKEKLVIVVTHNRELAETYGDRIIELKDGEILKDLATNTLNEHIEYPELIAKSIYKFPKNQKIGDNEIAKMNELFKNSPREYYLSVEQKPLKVKALYPHLKEALDKKEDDVEQFRQYMYPKNTVEEDITFAKSKLPISDALKLGMINIKKKIINFIILLILTVATLLIFGVSVNFNEYNNFEGMALAIKNSNIDYYTVKNQYEPRLRKIQVKQLENHFDNTGAYFDDVINVEYTINANNKEIYSLNSNGYIETDDISKLFDFKFIFKSETHFNDPDGIIISNYLAKQIVDKYNDIYKKHNIDIVYKTMDLKDSILNINKNELRVVGVYDYDYSKYSKVLTDLVSSENYDLRSEFLDLVNLHLGRVFCRKNAIANQKKIRGYIDSGFLINFDNPNSIIGQTGSIMKEDPSLYYDFYTPSEPVTSGNYFYADRVFFKSFYGKTEYELNNMTEAELVALLDEFNSSNHRLAFSINDAVSQPILDMKIIAYVDSNLYAYYVSSDITDQLIEFNTVPNSILVKRSGNSISNITNDLIFFNNELLLLTNVDFYSAQSFISLINGTAPFFNVLKYIMMILVIFLLFLFLSSSIRKNKKQIGILRALGAQQSDIFKIFISEAVIIGGISLLGSICLYFILGSIINTSIIPGTYIPLILFNANPPFQMVLTTLLVIGFSLILPIIRLTKIKVVDLIQTL